MSHADEALLDFQQLQELKNAIGENPQVDEELRGLLRVYLVSSRELLGRLKDTVKTGDKATAAAVVHTLKGASAGAGAKKVREASLALERSLKFGEGDAPEKLAADLESSFEETVHALERCYGVKE